mgnify:CR=1 FL=1
MEPYNYAVRGLLRTKAPGLTKLIGKEAAAVRLFSSLIIDNNKAKNLLDWHPVTSMDEQLCKILKNEKNI